MRRSIAYWTATLCVIAGAHSARAQAVRGIARDSTTSAPLPGVVLTVIDSAGATVSRTITDAAGRFTLPVLPSTARIHVVRIGYRPRDFASLAASRPLEFAMSRIPP